MPGGSPILVASLRAEAPLAPSARFGLGEVDEVRIGRGAVDGGAIEATRRERRLRLQAPDRFMSTEHARIVRERGRFVVEDLGAKNGVYRQGVRVSRSVLSDGDVLELGHTFFVYREAQPEAADLVLQAGAIDPLRSLQPGLAELRVRLERAAASTLPLLVVGETGTGKELVARAIHARSTRPGDFVPVNCGALPAALVESELFGYRKGAFSGAQEDRAGLVRASHRGTLFLDEIGELPAPAQVALLRVLQESEVRPIGATRATPVDLRVVAATHRDLESMVDQGAFRADLLARLRGIVVPLPPLRRRREDLGLIVAALLARRAPDRPRVTLSHGMARALFSRPWPGNVRELELTLAAALAISRDDEPLTLADEPPPAGAEAAAAAPPRAEKAARELSEADRRRRDQLVELLSRNDGNLTAVARELGKAREQVYRWLDRYGLDPAAYRSSRRR